MRGPRRSLASTRGLDDSPKTLESRVDKRRRFLRLLLSVVTTLLLVTGVILACSSAGAVRRPTDPQADSDAPTSYRPSDPASVPAPEWSMLTSGGPSISQFRDLTTNYEGAGRPEISTVPSSSDVPAIRFEMPGGGKRTELEPKIRSFAEGDEAWFGFSWFLPADFPVDIDGWQVLAQWKNDGDGSPPIEIKVRDGRFVLDGGAGSAHPGADYFTRDIGPARPGQFTALLLRINFSSDPGRASVDVWQNGQQQVSSFRPPAGTLYPDDDSYLKTGIYRDTGIDQSATLYLVDARVGSSFATTSALRVPPQP